MYPDDDDYDGGYVELPPPPVNQNAGFWQFGLVQLCLVAALAVGMLVTRSPDPEPTLERMILSATELETPGIAGTIAAPIPSTTPVPIPRMREPDGAPAPGWVVKAKVEPASGKARSGDFVTYANRDLVGGDYDSFRNVGQDECASRCKADGRCRAYTYNTWDNVCFVKSSLSTLRIEPRGVTGVFASEKVREDKRPPVIQKSRSRLFPGVPYRQIQSSAYEGCAKACLGDAACLGFNFSKANRSCGLMASLDKPVAGKSTDLGIKVQRSASRPAPRHASAYADLPPDIAPIFDAVLHELMR